LPYPGKIKRKAADAGMTERELIEAALAKTATISVAGAARELELHSGFSLRNWLDTHNLHPVIKVEVTLEATKP
jgi:hypothetical protein